MTTTTTTTALEKAIQAAQKATQKADDLRAKQRQAERAAQAARDEAEARFWDERQANYVRDYGGKIKAARDAFVDAVRGAGDVHAAWAAYRSTRVVVADEFQAFATVHARRHDDAVRARLAVLLDLNQRAGLLDTTPRPERGPGWRAGVEAWQRDAAAYLGTDDPGRPRALANDLPRLMSDRVGGLGGPDPDDDADFGRAFAAAVAQIEREALAEHRDARHAVLAEMQDAAERAATS